ncbi:hypothetical protein HF576_02020 [Microbacterium sp. CFH 90308]|uniref:Uncharacterized protein n=1 Tax=Microbacterium salsuginis TaxID=2722803 RepID=A0ABX1K6I0_9MICO|nr:hypothetical protein [Microbacterium sp. CFH 90308]NLP82616.1 hypothetical protein [Microbacterium sp. CFH 90308]
MSLFDSSNKGLKFDQIGVSHSGTVKSAPRERQQTKFGSQEPDFWPNGDPKMQILVDLQTNEREDPNDDGTRTLYVASKNMKRAISDAIRAAGASDILPGGVLTVQYVGNDPASANPANPAKLYAVQYTAPTSAFVQPAAAAPAAQPVQQSPTFVPTTANVAPQQAVQQPVPQQQAPFAAPAQQPPHPSGLTQDQIAQLQQLRAAQIPEATIATAIGATAQQIAVLDATPF